ncbi:YqeG family HAD IIIA-type phosphatase [Liquorilactobacillus capillatus]|uniref:HAD superfamily hydrolase n=1 Tax=Liquorilactobacillus capillatus DSM 19910 TaxID=1423731 RepID=A0A0R1M547_9LACO|nr:YqeG family HAD IIIA-type phosphatase [Liquorilactobacillus capillatus]KRL03206.1 HAD superfamily hydrolase [Liquorilactobacillus capillatus DSM 19910]
MFTRFKPTWMLESIYDLKPAELKKRGIKVVLTDLDNTLIAWNNPNGTAELKHWLEIMQEEAIPVVVVSNNSKKRVAQAVAPFKLLFISRALKPFSYGINKAKRELKLKNHDLILVGDQLVTDVAAAHAAGIRSVLVKPIIETDAWNTRINRFFERIIKKKLIKDKAISATWRHSLDD